MADNNKVGEALAEDVLAGRLQNDVDVNALEEELAALMLQDNGEPLPLPTVHSLQSVTTQSKPLVDQQGTANNTVQDDHIAELLPDIPTTSIPNNPTKKKPTVALVS